MKPRTVILIVENARDITGGLNAIRHAIGPLQDMHLCFEYVLPTGSAARKVLEFEGYVVHELPFVEISRRNLICLLTFLCYCLMAGA
jgi:hypothetical protein